MSSCKMDMTIQCNANCQWCTTVITWVIPATKTKNNKKTEPPSGEVDPCETKLHCYKRYFSSLEPSARHFVVTHCSQKQLQAQINKKSQGFGFVSRVGPLLWLIYCAFFCLVRNKAEHDSVGDFTEIEGQKRSSP